jgi:polyphosphate glucokinase
MDAMNILTIDIGGTNVKMLATGQTEPRRFHSGPTMTPGMMVDGVRERTVDWNFQAISIGYPGVIKGGKITAEPRNLGPGWVGFDFAAAAGRPVKLINDAAMQALGSFNDGILLFLGLGTGLGSAMVAEGVVVPMELGHLSYRDGIFEDYVGARGLERLGLDEWQKHVGFGVARLMGALHPDDVVIGGGNAKKLKELPPGCRRGDNDNAFIGGFRLWEAAASRGHTAST